MRYMVKIAAVLMILTVMFSSISYACCCCAGCGTKTAVEEEGDSKE